MTFSVRETSDTLVAMGPVIRVWIGLPYRLTRALRFHNQPVSPPIQVSLVIDTGATRCVVKPSVFERLGLPPYDYTHINTPSTTEPKEVAAHLADLVFDDTTVIRDLRMLAAPLNHQAIDGLLGRDVLMHGVLHYRGIHKSWSLDIHPPPYEAD